MKFENTVSFARKLDNDDPLKNFRDKFIIPEKDGKQKIYFLGNSLGLQPKSAKEELEKMITDYLSVSLGIKKLLNLGGKDE